MKFFLTQKEAEEAIRDYVGKKLQPNARIEGHIYMDDEHDFVFEVCEIVEEPE